MANLKFMGVLYLNSARMHAGIAEAWIYGDGNNSRADVASIFATHSDAQLAIEAESDWDLTETTGYEFTELVAAINQIRSDLNDSRRHADFCRDAYGA
jgi:hypothetical protein